MSCAQADELYATGRVMGAPTTGLLEHAEHCEQWPPHALWQSLWPVASSERDRRHNYEAWRAELRARN